MVELVPMSDPEFDAHIQGMLPEYAESHARTGHFRKDEALARAREEVSRLVPQGARTPGHHVYFIVPDGGRERVGVVWFRLDRESADPELFIYDLRIFEPYRRRGYARQALTALETKARELGVGRISLHVFGENFAARALYEKMGYIATNLRMSKSVPVAPRSSGEPVRSFPSERDGPA
jgi:RimJ/RimL family protein N-acetyltransferase